MWTLSTWPPAVFATFGSAISFGGALKLFAAALDILAGALYRVATCNHHQHGRTRKSHEFTDHGRFLSQQLKNQRSLVKRFDDKQTPCQIEMTRPQARAGEGACLRTQPGARITTRRVLFTRPHSSRDGSRAWRWSELTRKRVVRGPWQEFESAQAATHRACRTSRVNREVR